MSSVTRDSSLVALGQMLFKGTLYLGSIFLSVSLSVNEFAAFGYFLVTSTFLAMFFSGGLRIAATKAFADAAVDPSKEEETAAVLLLMLGASIFAVLASPLYLPAIADEAIQIDSAWLLAGGAAQAIHTVALAAMFGVSAFRQSLWPLVIGSSALLVGAVASAWAGDLAPALLGVVLSFVIPAMLYGSWLYRAGSLTLTRPSARASASVAFMALPTLALGIITAGVSWLVTRVLLENAVSTSEFNKFVIGMQWFVLVLFLPNALGNALFPRFIRDAREGRLNVRLAAAATFSAFAAIAAVAVLAALLTPALSMLYNYEFDRAFVFAILAAAALAGPVSMLSYPIMAVFGVHYWLGANLALLGVSVGLLAWSAPSTALDAALIVCAGQGAVLIVALLMLVRATRSPRA